MNKCTEICTHKEGDKSNPKRKSVLMQYFCDAKNRPVKITAVC